MSVPDVDEIVNDEAMNTFLAGQLRGPMKLAPEAWQQMSKPARSYAFHRVLESLRRRSPSISYDDLKDPSQLSDAIKYGAAEHICQMQMNDEGDLYDTQRKIWQQKFIDELISLSPELTDGTTASARTFTILRR